MSTPSPEEKNTYFIDAESVEETVRLTLQGNLITEGMGGIFPEHPDLSDIDKILDIACGPGSWVLGVAHAYPDREVVGIDISESLVEYAFAQARSQLLDNVHFEVMNALNPLDFPDNAFDLVNARLIIGFMPTTSWPRLLAECLRITRPGGRIRLTECEGGMCGFTSSPACERLNRMGAQALHRAGRSFSPDGVNVGTTPMLGGLLRNAGYQQIQHAAYAIDWSAGAALHEGFCQDFFIGFQLLEPFLLKWNVTTHEEFEHLHQQMQREFLSRDFRALWYFLTVWGTKPEEGGSGL